MKKIGIIPNAHKDIGFHHTEKIINWLLEKGHTPLLNADTIKDANFSLPSESSVTSKELYSESDFLIVLGGDGTVLKVSKEAAINQKPILGINLGTLGYITDIDYSDCYEAIEKAINGDYVIENRMMLEATADGKELENDILIALNDVCITRGFFGNIISLELYINDHFIDSYRGDGMILSTPTGSTAYNLSAGGPILKPDSKMIAITPICPHMLYTRAFVISSEDTIKVKVINQRELDILLSLDGQNVIPLKDQDIIKVKTSDYYTKLIKTNNLGFYDILRKKMVGVKERKVNEDSKKIKDN